MKNSYNNCKYLEWILLILPNKTHIINEDFSERFYQLFNYLLKQYSNFSEKNKKIILEVIKEYISYIFEKGINYAIIEEIIITKLIEDLINKMHLIKNNSFNKFIKGKKVNELKTFVENITNNNNEDSLLNLKKKLQKNIMEFEIKYSEKEIEKKLILNIKLWKNNVEYIIFIFIN